MRAITSMKEAKEAAKYKCSKCGRQLILDETRKLGVCCDCLKKTLKIRSYESLRRWAEKKIGDAYNLWIMEQVLREINEAFKQYVKMDCKEVEVVP